MKKIILKVQWTIDNLQNIYRQKGNFEGHDNLQNIYRQKGNFEGLCGLQNKWSNLILRIKRPLNNLLPMFKRFIFTTLEK